MYKTNTEKVKFQGLNVEGIDMLHSIQVCTEFNEKAPHLIVSDSLKLELVSGLASSSAFTIYYNTLDFFFGFHWNKIQWHILMVISFKMKVSFDMPSVYLTYESFLLTFSLKAYVSIF